MRRRKQKETTVPILFLTGLAVLGGLWLGNAVYRHFHKPGELILIDDRNFETETSSEIVPVSEPMKMDSDDMTVWEASLALSGLPAGYTTERRTEESTLEGLLASASDSPLTDFQNKNEYYHLKDNTLQVQENTVRAMNALAEAYHTETGRSDLMIYSSTQCCPSEGALYPDFFPDRSTGFCLDLAFLNADGTISVINETNCLWLYENAYRFGFIFSVPDAPYHIRYVGKVHAFLMHQQNLSLEAYLETLRNYPVSAPYYCTYEEKSIQIYFVPAAAFGSTDVPVPDDRDYEISGNGRDGFIVRTSGINQKNT
ncbi:MAG: D-alanyl-D-alanine carboxypeptidase family protein [Ruminococcus sp.]|nr:D-alanyl-D-alanine carboxypeptidase family protein [Ruminococcus sp.]